MASAHWKHPDTGTVDYVQPLAPGENNQNPARLHLANYTTNYNHCGFNGPQNLEAYLLSEGLDTWYFYGLAERLRAGEIALPAGLRAPRSAVPGERRNLNI